MPKLCPFTDACTSSNARSTDFNVCFLYSMGILLLCRAQVWRCYGRACMACVHGAGRGQIEPSPRMHVRVRAACGVPLTHILAVHQRTGESRCRPVSLDLRDIRDSVESVL